MKQNEIILRLIPDKDFNQEKFVMDIANHRPVDLSKCRVFQIHNVVSNSREEFIEDIFENSLTGLLRRRPIVEKVVPQGQERDYIADIMVKFLKKIGVDDELVIVDPYFFAGNMDNDYAKLIQSILSPFTTQLGSIRVVTRPDRVDSFVKQAIESEIKSMNKTIQITHSFSDDYHDRFWISSNRSKGILTGSSLNGLGRKYAIIDRLSSTDVKDIVDSLVKNHLI